MYLDNISIRNFRIFDDFSLTLNRGLNVLVGENDSGKTAFVDAIRYTLGTNTSEKTYVTSTDFHADSKELGITLKFVKLDAFAHVFLEHLTYEEISGGQREAVLYVTLHASYSDKERRGYPVIKTEFKSGKDGNGIALESEIRSFLASTYLKPLRDAGEELSSGRGSRLSQILGSSNEFNNTTAIDEILTLIATTNTTLLLEDKPINKTSKTIQDNYLHKLIFDADKESLKAIIDIAGIKNIESLNSTEKRRYLRNVLETLNLSLSEKNYSHGLGYQNILFMAAELLLLEQEKSLEFSLLLIEEPEAHIHPQLQMKLLSFLKDIVQSPTNANGIQCILTTHSPNISSSASPEEVIIMCKGTAHSLKKEETLLEDVNYLFLQKFLDVTKANLFFSRGVILVEGASENILVPTLAKLLKRPLESFAVSIVNIGNTGWKHFAKLFIKNGKDAEPESWLPIKVSVMRDLDLWPACAEEIPANTYGFKTRKARNAAYWESSVADIPTHKLNMKHSLEKQNIKVFISDKWTFEYCLAYYGLFDECYEALTGSTTGAELIVGSAEEKATYILREATSLKTDLSHKLVTILERKYATNPTALRDKLPPYVVLAIENVTFANDQANQIVGDTTALESPSSDGN